MKEKVSSLALVFQQLGGHPGLGVGYGVVHGVGEDTTLSYGYGNGVGSARAASAAIASGVFTEVCSGLGYLGKWFCCCFRRKFQQQFSTTGQFIYTKKDSDNEKTPL